MKNANVFVDVDLTLVDANGKLLDGAREALLTLKAAGCHLFLWSNVGAEYCRKVAEAHHLADLFEGFTAKPDIAIDDMPSTCVPPFVYNVQQEASWPALARRIHAAFAANLIAEIVSGGQTGADRAALDFAIEDGIPDDGWCPQGAAGGRWRY